MLNSTIIEILKTFSEDEISRFADFVSSPYYNKKTAVTKLWGVIKHFFPEFNSPQLEREKIYGKIFPGKDYNYGTFKNLVFDLTKLAEKFLATQKLEAGNFESNFYILTQLKDRSLAKLFNQKYKNVEKAIESVGGYSEAQGYYIDLLEIRTAFDFFNSPGNLAKDDFIKTFHHTVFYFIYMIFENYNNILSINAKPLSSDDELLVRQVIQNINFEKILAEIKRESLHDYKILQLAYKKYLAEANPDKPDFYYEYKKYLIDNFDLLSRNEKYNNFNSLVTPLMLMNADTAVKAYEYNDNNKLRVKNNLVLDKDGSLSPAIYAGIISNAAWMKDAVFIEDLIGAYHIKLSSELKEGMSSFEMAYLNYAKGNYGKALEYCAKIDSGTFSFKHFIKNLQLILHYEMDDYESFLYLKDSYKRFLSYGKPPKTSNESFLYLIKYVDKLFKIKEDRNAAELDLVKREISGDNIVRMKLWLMEKIDDLEKNISN